MLGGTSPLADLEPSQDTEPLDSEKEDSKESKEEKPPDASSTGGLAATQASFTGMESQKSPPVDPRDPAAQTLGMAHTFESTNAGGESGDAIVRAPLGSSGLGMPSQRGEDQGLSPVSANKAKLGSTMLGMPSPLSKEPPTPEAPPQEKRPLGGTMIGMPSPFASNPKDDPQPSTIKGALGGTMIGMTSPFAPGQSESLRDPNTLRAPTGGPSPMGGTKVGMPSPVRHLETEQPTPNPEQGPSLFDLKNKTVTGMGQPELVLAAERAQKAALSSEAADEAKFKGTLLGIAQPGIAPTHEGAPSANYDGSSHYSQRPPSVYPSSIPPSMPPPRRPLWRTTVIVAIGLLMAAAIGGLLAMLNKDPLTVVVQEFAVDDKGRDRLKLHCATCPDGSTLKLGGASAKVESEQVVFLTEKPLKLGKNVLAFSLVGPHGEELEVAPLVLPIAFRVRTDWEGMHLSPPYGRVLVDAPAGSRVTIDGNPLPLKDGQAEYKVDLGEKTNGENALSERVALNLPVEVQMNKSIKSASASLKGVIAPLTLSSLGPVHELNGKAVTVTGRSAPGALITALDQKTEANKDGTFRLDLGAVSPQTVDIRASGVHLIPRSVSVQLVEKAGVPDDARTTFAELKQGGNASFAATVLESRIKEGVTQVLADVTKGCKKGPCLVRLVYAAPTELKEESKINVIGVASSGDPITVRVTKFR